MMLELYDLTHRYGAEPAVEDVSFGVASGELVALLGPSGCGKTTIVSAIAGHVIPTAGRITLRGDDVTGDPPESRNVGVVFQQSTLYPHMTVGENVEYGLIARDVDPDRRAAIVHEYLDLVDLADRADAYPSQLSGGQKRRVELARALAPRPDVLLLDEPLSALDRGLRERLREEIARIQAETGVTTLFVTHDQEEAMALADRLVVMNDGGLAGVGRPRELYESPPTPFVASFLGRSNAITGTIVNDDPLTIRLADRTDDTSPAFSLPGTTTEHSVGSAVTCHVRPEDVSVRSAENRGGDPTLEGDLVRVSDIGRRYDVFVRLPGGEEILVERRSRPPAVGSRVAVEFPNEAVTLFGRSERDHAEPPTVRH